MISTNHSSADNIGFFGKMLTFTRLKLTINDLAEIEHTLDKLLDSKDSQIPVVIDSDVSQELPALVELLWSRGLQPIGVVTGPLDEDAIAQRLAIFPADGKRIERIRPTKMTEATTTTSDANSTNTKQTETNDSAAQSVETKMQPTEPKASDKNKSTPKPETEKVVYVDNEGMTSRIYDLMLRSGQSLNHVGGDLVLTNGLNNGSEAITDNSLHVYGKAQGRLVAGATGDEAARIFCMQFNPSLVSVAGTYCLSDSIPPEMIDKPVQVRFEKGRGLVFERLDTSPNYSNQ